MGDIKLTNTITIGENELKELYFNQDKKFITTYRRIYQIHYSVNGGFYVNELYYQYNGLPLTKKGRYFITKAKWVNDLLDREFLID